MLIFWCTLSHSFHYLVSAEIGERCFEVIDETEQISACYATPGDLQVRLATQAELDDWKIQNEVTGELLQLSKMQTEIDTEEVLFSSEWD